MEIHSTIFDSWLDLLLITLIYLPRNTIKKTVVFKPLAVIDDHYNISDFNWLCSMGIMTVIE